MKFIKSRIDFITESNQSEPIQQSEVPAGINEHIFYLNKYLNMSDHEKAVDLTFKCYFMLEDFLSENGIDFEYVEEDFEDNVVNFKEQCPEEYELFANMIQSKMEKHRLPLMDAEYPSWHYFEDTKIVTDEYLIHFTNNLTEVLREGFKRGIYDMEQLGLTTHFSESRKTYGGYNFAYLATQVRSLRSNYGKYAVIFKADSMVKTYHIGDEEIQYIFWGEDIDPKGIRDISEGDNAKFALRDNDDELIFESDDIHDIIEYIRKGQN